MNLKNELSIGKANWVERNDKDADEEEQEEYDDNENDEEYQYEDDDLPIKPTTANKRKRKETSDTFTVAASLMPLLEDLVKGDDSPILKVTLTITEEEELLYNVKGPKLLKLLAEDSISQLSKSQTETVTNLSEFFESVLNYMVVLRQQCPICKKSHERIVDRMTPCADNNCMTFFMEHGMGRNILADICYEPTVVDLLISIAYWATDERPEIMEANFNHFPTRFIQKTGESSVKQYGNIRDALNRLPAVPVMKEMIDSGLFDSYMNDDPYDYESFYLLQWIINSNRTQLKYLPYEKQTTQEATISQNNKYKLFQIKNSPERESKFESEKQKLGNPSTEFTYHGSRASSWHSIIRNSLKSLSGTSRQINGAAYGSGIYMSTDFSLAAGYTRPTNTHWPQTTLRLNRCILMLELIKSNTLRSDTPSNFRVETDENHIIARYLICE
jgi:ubiquitin-conjugating enzyme E2 Q